MSNRRSVPLAFSAVLALAGASLLAPSARLDAQGFDWVRPITSTSFTSVGPTALDSVGNAYVGGGFAGTLTLGEGEVGETSLVSGGALDAFLAKFGPAGDLLWAVQTVTIGSTSIMDVAANDAFVHVTGTFSDATTFGPGEINETTVTPAPSSSIFFAGDFFVAAFDPAGTFLWVKTIHIDSASIYAYLLRNSIVATDSLGNVYVSGWSGADDGDTLTFDPGGSDETVLPIPVGDFSVPFLAKFDMSGGLQWARVDPPSIAPDPATAGVGPLDMAAVPGGGVALTGYFVGNVVFAPGEINETALTGPPTTGSADIFVARYDAAGALLWVREGDWTGALGNELSQTVFSNAIAVDSAGNSYIAGSFATGLLLGPGEANETELTAVGTSTGDFLVGDLFVAKFAPGGDLLWARQDGGSDGDSAQSIAIDAAGDSFVVGTYGARATFGFGESGETELWAAPSANPAELDGQLDMFVSSYDSNGAFRWARRAGGTLRDSPQGVAVAADGEVRVSGVFDGPLTFGPGEAGESTLFAPAEGAGFLANFSAVSAFIDADGDGIEDAVDPDDDGDGTPDEVDEYPYGQFADAPPDFWSFTFIELLASSGITSGCGDGTYCPNDPVTRAQMAVFLERGIHGSTFSPPPATGTVFTDVAASDFAAGFIERFYLDGITSGCGGGRYCPNDPVTRAQMAVFLLRAKYGAGYLPPAPSGLFDDVDVAYWAAAWIEQLAAEGITSGCGGGNFCPAASVTRAQMAVFLIRTFGL